MSRRRRSNSLLELLLLPFQLAFAVLKMLVAIVVFPFYRLYRRKHAKPRRSRQHTYLADHVQDNNFNYGYSRVYLLTKRELDFYRVLQPIAYRLGYMVLAKVRMADLVRSTLPQHSRSYMRAFGKIKAKHVDFVLARPENLYIDLLIELDDSTHTKGNARDAFVEKVYAQTGYKLFRTRTTHDLEQRIVQALGDTVLPQLRITMSPKQPRVEVPKYQFSQDKNTEDLAADFEKQVDFKPELEPQPQIAETK